MTVVQNRALRFWYENRITCFILVVFSCSVLIAFLLAPKKYEVFYVWSSANWYASFFTVSFLPGTPFFLLSSFVFLDVFVQDSNTFMQVQNVSNKHVAVWFVGDLFFCFTRGVFMFRYLQLVWVLSTLWRTLFSKQKTNAFFYSAWNRLPSKTPATWATRIHNNRVMKKSRKLVTYTRLWRNSHIQKDVHTTHELRWGAL
jgi:hypothetical protein